MTEKQCNICGEWFHSLGYASHRASCCRKKCKENDVLSGTNEVENGN